ncbi:MAG: sulfite exporter TauE/SafE family protein [Bacteroidales bacterium]|nr:sulfite exporter TauE/SafE family protein [Bacteroidales bacterium]MBN2819443.1 sulfite exporter TauE/SafE family protein [Bacteroidales bacterium]
MNDFLMFVVLFFAGAVANFINIMAGGGSVITLGIMMLLGIDPSVANGTNRISVFVGAGAGATAYKSEKFTDLKQSLIFSLCAIPGAIIGSVYSVSIEDELFKNLIALVMIFVLITLFIPKKKKTERTRTSYFIYPAMVFVGLYGGFIQAGVGFLLMASFRHLLAYDLIRTNMHKTFVVLIYTIPVLLIFGISGNIHWLYAIVLSLGSIVGSWISVKLSIKKGEKLVKFVLAISIILMAAKFFFE